LLCNVWLHPVEQAGEGALRRWRLPPTLRGPPWPSPNTSPFPVQHS